MENKDQIEEYLPADATVQQTEEFFSDLAARYSDKSCVAVHIPNELSFMYGKAYEDVRRMIIEGGHLKSIPMVMLEDFETLEFDFTSSYDSVDCWHYATIRYDRIAAKHYLFDWSIYTEVYDNRPWYHSSTNLTLVPLTTVASVYRTPSDDEEQLILEKFPLLYEKLTADSDIRYEGMDMPTILPKLSWYPKEVLVSEDKVVYEPVDWARSPLMGPCILLFHSPKRWGKQNNRIAIVREQGPFCLSQEVAQGPIMCIRPKEGINLDYLAYVVMSDEILMDKLQTLAYPEYGEEVIELPFDLNEARQNKVVLDFKKDFIAANTDVNILIVGDDVSHIRETLVSEPGLNCLETCDYKRFSSKTITRYNKIGKTSVDAVIFKVDSVENLLSVIRERQNAASIPFYYFLNIDEQQIQPYRPLLNSPEDIFISGAEDTDSILLLGSTIKHDVVRTPSDGFLLRAEHAPEFSAAELTSGETAHLLTDLLAQKDLPDDMLRSSFNDIRRILDSIFSQPPFNKKLKLGAFATLLKEGCFVDEGCHCYYVDNVRKVMSEPLADALCYLVDQVNEESHGTDMLGYTIATGSMNLYRSALYIMLDVLKWYNDISKSDLELRYENLYQYKNVVEKNDDGIHFCGRIKLDPQKARGLAGKKVEIRSASANKYFAKDGFPLYSNDFKEIQ